jgi:hypothetical protein
VGEAVVVAVKDPVSLDRALASFDEVYSRASSLMSTTAVRTEWSAPMAPLSAVFIRLGE